MVLIFKSETFFLIGYLKLLKTRRSIAYFAKIPTTGTSESINGNFHC